MLYVFKSNNKSVREVETFVKLCLQTLNLCHRYAATGSAVLSGLSLEVIEGSIYGFVGPNGAGKTTTLRLILGLLRKQEGEIEIFGKSLDRHRIEVLRQVGSLVEGPSLYGHLTAVENLRMMQIVYRVPKERIPQVLELVGLPDVGDKLVGQFSLGMKQRLAIGMAFLHRPSLLILDEPTNDLDPNGIVAMRNLLKELNQQHGVTILISSHLLSEVERLVTHIGVVHRGRLRFQGTLDGLRRRQSARAQSWLSTSDDGLALKVLQQTTLSAGVEMCNGRIRLLGLSREELADVNRRLVSQGIDVHALGTEECGLETIFMEMVGD